METQKTISDWADITFGNGGTNFRCATRANEEMSELLTALASDDRLKALEEIADIYIVLCRVATRLDGDIHEWVERKMKINRSREWKLDGTGHGYHV